MINLFFVIGQLGLLMLILSASMLAVTLVAMPWLGMGPGEQSAQQALLLAVAIGTLIGLGLWWTGRKAKDYLGRREALLLVALSWLLGAGLAGLPYWFWAIINSDGVGGGHPFAQFVDCYFESMSGLTTTGATVLTDIETLPRCLLLWRAMTHWLGGLGIVVLFVAVLPTLGVGGKKLFAVEAPGPTAAGVRPRIGETARVLWMIYLLMTVSEIIILKLLGLSLFDSVCHTFATLATGGFSTYNASIGQINTLAVDITIIFFMLLAGVNFGIYYQIMRRNFKSVWQDPELRVYIGILVLASVLVAGSLYGKSIVTTDPNVPTIQQAGAVDALRYGVFQVVSIQTTTGFATADFNQWNNLAKATLLILMFVGACAGSTGGGMKVIRLLMAAKVMLSEAERVFRPNVVRTIRVGKWHIAPELRLGTLVYLLGILLIFGLGTVLLMMFETGLDFSTAATASAATLNNIGPGLARVGAIENYSFFSAPSKLLLSLLMALGRLEIYAIMVLLLPRFWHSQ